MSRASDRSKANEGRAPAWGRGGIRGERISPRKSQQMVCRQCGVHPCRQREECRKEQGSMRRINIYKCPCGKASLKQGKIKRHMRRMQKKGKRGHGT